MTPGINSAGTVGVDRSTKWKKIDSSTPRGVKLQLISKHAGVAQYGTWSPDDKFFTHYFELPTFDEDPDK